MHVALNAYFWNRPDTGSGQYLRQLVYHLNRLVSDLAITLVFPYPEAPAGVPPSVRVQRVTSQSGHLGKIWFEQIGFPRAAAAARADLAHVPYWGSPLQSPLPVVVTVHDLITLRQREYRRGLRARLYNALVASAARGASHVITDSEFSRREIVEHLQIRPERVSAIPLATAPQYRAQSELLLDMAVRRKYDLPEFYVLYLGGYTLHKNVPTLLHAYTYVAQAMGEDYPLVLAGRKPEPGASTPDYDDYVHRLQLGDSVRWIGFVDEEDKPAVYRGALCFAFPSRYEGFGLPPLEAMACGAPVVTTDASSIPEVVGDAAFAVSPDDARQMAGAIISVLIDEALAEELRQKGLQRAAQFSWEETATQTLLVYDGLLGGRPPGEGV
jgi:glycosyltransferase involved in cell wall biosynthesis